MSAEIDPTDAAQVIAQHDEWLNRLEAAAGMGLLADVAEHQRQRGVHGDHETRLREKRVAELVDLITEAAAFREDASDSPTHPMTGGGDAPRADVTRAAVVEREALARVFCQHRECCDDGCYAGRRFADDLLASGVLTDADDIAARVRRQVAEEIAQALADQIGSTSYRDAAFQQAVRIARAAADTPTPREQP